MMINNIPDNYDYFEAHEREQERYAKLKKKREFESELSFETVMNDYGTHKECYPNYKED